ncbi:TetR/AcrR family transcriptional regulator [Bordetella bronchialis]|uniref:TetR family transcriptional regulator n=1 Tax=Bordetella bronchialis TaxID=463025 RepID=A0ABM6CY48_9BORD|nr:TetR/AcrR family transcriptional regulator [Bordetella bronchialis]ANN68242.1 TetR family transcriptional regulator [Bordetella bronchialis]
MGRPREFDEGQALEQAMQCFWQHGYEATSVRDLAGHMNLTSASVYNAFGDKRELYRRALEHYIDISIADRIERLRRKPAVEAIQGFFDELIERSLTDPERKGCMLVNSALEMAPRDPELRELVAEVLRRIEAFFRRCVEAGQQDGSITSAQPAADLARMLLGVQLGLRVLARSRPEPALLRGMVRAAVASLAPASP